MTELIGGPSTSLQLGHLLEKPAAASVSAPVRPGRLPVETLVDPTILALVAAVLGMSSPWLMAFVVLVVALNHRELGRAGRLSSPVPGVVHGTALPVALAALGSAGGVVEVRDLQVVILLSGLGAAVMTVGSWARRSSEGKVRIALVGAPADIMTISTRWADDRRIQVVGGLAVGGGAQVPRQRSAEEELLQHREHLHVRDRLVQMRPDVVVVVPGDAWDPEVVRRLGWELEDTGIELVVASRLEGIATHRLAHERVGGVGLVRVRPSRPARWVRTLKNALDRLLGLTLLGMIAPLLAVLVLAIRLTSPGAGFFSQVRVGQDGRHFRILKLRTMVCTAESDKELLKDEDEGNGLLFKKRDDPRVTRLGRVLRKYSIDELPQLVNVVKGEMSLVGPRPALPEEVAQYSELEHRRLVVRPGMTGAWQVAGRSTLGREESVRLDVEYADNYRLVDDVLIGMRTVDAVVRPKGAW